MFFADGFGVEVSGLRVEGLRGYSSVWGCNLGGFCLGLHRSMYKMKASVHDVG